MVSNWKRYGQRRAQLKKIIDNEKWKDCDSMTVQWKSKFCFVFEVVKAHKLETGVLKKWSRMGRKGIRISSVIVTGEQ